MGKNINVDKRSDKAGAYEIVSDCFRVVIIEQKIMRNKEIQLPKSTKSNTQQF